jgi:hypothetical protein
MHNLGLNLDVYREPVCITQPAPVKKVDPVSQWWYELISANPAHFKKQFASKKDDWFMPILYNTKLSPQQKFEKIFGIKISDIAKAATKSSTQLLGNIFDDISGWVSKTFSNENLKKLELSLRQGQNISKQISDALNMLRNKTDLTQQQMNLQDVQSKVVTSGTEFWNTYGLPIGIGGAFIVLLLLMKK